MNYHKHREQATLEIIEAIKKGTAPWMKPWDAGNISAVPCNGLTGRRYRGMNKLGLFMRAENNNYQDNRWFTFNQVQGLGGKINKGEKGTVVEYWQFKQEKNKKDEDGNLILDENGKPVKEVIRFQNPRVFHAVVFNAKQCSGIPPLEIPKHEWTPEQRAEKVLENSTAVIKHKVGDNAFYRPSTDEIVLPLRQQFKDEMSYYETAFHELSHWTGHETRLDRDMKGSFGSIEYSKEELRAELGALFVCGDLGLNFNPKNHANYIEGWVKAMEEDSNYIFKAAAEAEGIADYISNFENQKLVRDEVKHFKFDLNQDSDLRVLFVSSQSDTNVKLPYTFNFQNNSLFNEDDSYIFLSALQACGNNNFSNDNIITFSVIGGGKEHLVEIPLNDLKNLKHSNQEDLISDFLLELGVEKGIVDKIKTVEENYMPDIRKAFKQTHTINDSHRPKKSAEDINNELNLIVLNDETNQAIIYKDLNEMLDKSNIDAIVQANVKINLRNNVDKKEIISSLQAGVFDFRKTSLREVTVNLDENTTNLKESFANAYPYVGKDEISSDWFAATEIKVIDRAIEISLENYEKKVSSDNIIKNDDEKVFIAVPYQEKDEAKALGAKWDKEQKSWYYNKGVDSTDFEKWSNSKSDVVKENPKIDSAVFDKEKIKAVETRKEYSDKNDQKIPTENRNYIDVPFSRKDDVKELGARWDKEQKSWYVPAGIDVSKFDNLLTQQQQNEVSQTEIKNQNIAKENHFINVPFNELNQAKALGAKWDKEQKSWYVPAGKNIDDFKIWEKKMFTKKSMKSKLNFSDTGIDLNKTLFDMSKLVSYNSKGIEIKGLGVVKETSYTRECDKVITFEDGKIVPLTDVFEHLAQNEKPLDLAKLMWEEKMEGIPNISIALQFASILENSIEKGTLKFNDEIEAAEFKISIEDFKKEANTRLIELQNERNKLKMVDKKIGTVNFEDIEEKSLFNSKNKADKPFDIADNFFKNHQHKLSSNGSNQTDSESEGKDKETGRDKPTQKNTPKTNPDKPAKKKSIIKR